VARLAAPPRQRSGEGMKKKHQNIRRRLCSTNSGESTWNGG